MKTVLKYCLCLFPFLASGQEVDLVRLAYDEAALTSKQTAMAASPEGKHIAFAFEDKTVKVFDVAAGKFVKRFAGPFSALVDMYLTENGRVCFIGKQEVAVWDWKTGKSLATFRLPQEATRAAYAASAGLLAAGQFDGIVTIIDLDRLTEIRRIQYKKNHVSALAIHPGGKTIVIGAQGSGAFPNSLKLFDIASGQEIAESKKGVFTMAAFDKTGQKLIAGGRMGDVAYKIVTVLLDPNNMTLLRRITSKPMVGSILNVPFGAYASPDRVMVLSDTWSFDVIDMATGVELFTTMREQGYIVGASKFGVGSYNVFPLNASADKVIINTTKNNINQVYDARKNAMAGYFFCDSNDDFAVVSRDGRVEGTPGALDKLYWTSRKSTQKTSLESTFGSTHTPRLLSAIIGDSGSQLAAFDVDNVLDKIPVIEMKSINANNTGQDAYASTQKMLRIEVGIARNAGEVTSMSVYQNSKLVKSVSADGKSSYIFDVPLTNSFGEANYFFVTATSKSGIDSEKLKFVVNYKGATSAPPRLYLITIGINNYKNPKYNLNFAQADADGVHGSISRSSASIFKEIISFAIRNDSAVKDNIISALNHVRSQAFEQDMVVLYYAGHGVMSEGTGRDKDFFIVPHDVTQLYGRDDLLFERAISATELRTITQQINAQKQVFILDACQSSGALESVESKNRGVAEEKAIAQLARSTGTFWIASTGTEQFAAEFDKLGHGIFTYALLEGLAGGADVNGDKKLTIRELSTYIENKVPELSEQLKGTPQFPSAYSFGNDFPIAVYGGN